MLSKILHAISLRIPLIGANHDKQPQTKRYTRVDDTDWWIFNKRGSFDASNLTLYGCRWLRCASCAPTSSMAPHHYSALVPPGEQRSTFGPAKHRPLPCWDWLHPSVDELSLCSSQSVPGGSDWRALVEFSFYKPLIYLQRKCKRHTSESDTADNWNVFPIIPHNKQASPGSSSTVDERRSQRCLPMGGLLLGTEV